MTVCTEERINTASEGDFSSKEASHDISVPFHGLRAVDRTAFLMDCVVGKNVLHVGCADWPATETELAAGSLLHGRLAEHAESLTGVDISPQGIALMRKADFEGLHVADGQQPLDRLLSERFDVVIVGEILEEVPNLGSFLDSVRSVCGPHTRLVVTATNSTPLKRMPFLLCRREKVYRHHVCKLSPATLCQLLTQHGFEMTACSAYWYNHGRLRGLNPAFRRLASLQLFADGFCVEARVAGELAGAKEGNPLKA